MPDEQQQKANAAALALGGSSVLTGFVPPPEVTVPGLDGKDHIVPFVRLPSDGHGEQKFYQQVGAILCHNGVYRQGREPVVIDGESGEIVRIDPLFFKTYCAYHMVTAKFVYNSKTGELKDRIERTMSVDHARACLKSPWFMAQQRLLKRVNKERMPVQRKSNAIELLPVGYDVESKIYTMPSEIVYDETMTKEQAHDVIDGLIREFPWGDIKEDNEANRAAGVVGQSRSKAVHVATMLGLFGRSLIHELTPRLHTAYVANAQGSGKTLLAKTALVTIYGPSDATPKPESEDDLRKLLTTAAVTGQPYLFLDDLAGRVESQALNAFMMAPKWSDRGMGSHTKVSAIKDTVVLLTGNNLSFSPDITRRTLRCGPLYKDQVNANREIEHVIDEEYLARPDTRAKVLSALWALVRDWDRNHRPMLPAKQCREGFQAWCGIIGGIVVHAGFGNPLEEPPSDDGSGDTDLADMLTIVEELVKDMDKRHDVAATAALAAERGQDEEEMTKVPLLKDEFTFEDLIQIALENNCFEFQMDGPVKTEGDKKTIQLTQRGKSQLGKIFALRYGGRQFNLKDGRKVMFGKRGRNRHRKYNVEILAPGGAGKGKR